jgi:hypothetical protein
MIEMTKCERCGRKMNDEDLAEIWFVVRNNNKRKYTIGPYCNLCLSQCATIIGKWERTNIDTSKYKEIDLTFDSDDDFVFTN